jgi:hypothetical protein
LPKPAAAGICARRQARLLPSLTRIPGLASASGRDHRLAVQVDRYRGADVVVVQRFGQRLSHGTESVSTDTMDFGHDEKLTRRPPAGATE